MMRAKIIVFACISAAYSASAQPAVEAGDRDEPVEAADRAETPEYRDPVRLALQPVAGGLTAPAAAARALGEAPVLEAATTDIELVRARNSRTLARYVPKLSLAASWSRQNQIGFDFSGGGFSVGALTEGPLVVGSCPDSAADNCVVDSSGQPVAAFAQEPFDIPVNNYSLEINLLVPLSDYALLLQPARRGSRADVEAATRRRDGQIAQIELDAKLAYYQWLKSVAQIAVAEESLQSATARLDDARILLEGGSLVPADVLQYESIEATAKIALSDARSFELVARKQLALIIGSDEENFAVGESIFVDLPAPAELGGLDRLVERALSKREEVVALRESSRAAQEAEVGSDREKLPRVDATASVLHANPNQRFFPPTAEWNTSWVVGVTASWSLDRYLNARSLSRELSATQAKLTAELAGLERAIRAEVIGAYQEVARVHAAIALSSRDVAAAKAAYEQRVLLYRAGEATTSEVIEAEVQRTTATLRALHLRIDERIARARLARAIGASLSEGGTDAR